MNIKVLNYLWIYQIQYFLTNSFSCGFAVAITKVLDNYFVAFTLAGAVALVGVISNANLNFILSTILLGSLILF